MKPTIKKMSAPKSAKMPALAKGDLYTPKPVPNPASSPLVKAIEAKQRIGVRKPQTPAASIGKGIAAIPPKVASKGPVKPAGKTSSSKAKPTDTGTVANAPKIDQKRSKWTTSGGGAF